MRIRRVLTVVATIALSLGSLGALPAAAAGGPVGGSGSVYYLNDAWTGSANRTVIYGADRDQTYVGDWDGNRTDTLAVRRGATFHLTNTNGSQPSTSRTLTYGRAADQVLVGDWNGDGKDTFAVRRGNVYYFSNSLTSTKAEKVIVYGRASDVVLVGDWNGDGKDTLAVRRGSAYHVKNSINGGKADQVIVYGRATDAVLVGDWNGDRKDTLAVRRGSVYHVKNSMSAGAADRVITYGRAGDTALVGDWNGDGKDTLGVRRPVMLDVIGPNGYGFLELGMSVAQARAADPSLSLTGAPSLPYTCAYGDSSTAKVVFNPDGRIAVLTPKRAGVRTAEGIVQGRSTYADAMRKYLPGQPIVMRENFPGKWFPVPGYSDQDGPRFRIYVLWPAGSSVNSVIESVQLDGGQRCYS